MIDMLAQKIEELTLEIKQERSKKIKPLPYQRYK